MLEIIPLHDHHAEQVLKIYKEGLDSGIATFNTEVPDWHQWDKNHLAHSRLIAIDSGEIAAWAALSPVSSRDCYNGVAEFSIYISEKFRSKGIGTTLLNELIRVSEQNGIWTLYSATFEENTASIALQKKCGFRIIGIRERIARLHGKWRNTVILERRSQTTGVD